MRRFLLNKYISREFLINFFLSFCFFFFIFFINQLLVMLRLDEVKNLSVKVIVELILLSTPQFLTYTFPFSTLTAAAMVIGDFATKNEILAMRSLGFSLRNIYLPFFFMSVLTMFGTSFIANIVNPWASDQYKNVFAQVIRDMPTVALKPNSVTSIGNATISVGNVKNGRLENIRIFDISDETASKLITAKSGSMNQLSKDQYVYQLTLDSPEILFTNNSDTKQYSVAKADSLIYALDMTSMLPDFGEPSSSQVYRKELIGEINYEKGKEKDLRIKNYKQKVSAIISLSRAEKEITSLKNPKNIYSYADDYNSSYQKLKTQLSKSDTTYRRAYYESEFFKRSALSFACIILGLLAFPLSFIKIRHGRLIGFALSMVVACLYWCMLFFAQMFSLSNYDRFTFAKMWVPNVFFFLIAAILLWRNNKS